MQWAPYSPDVNPIENLWALMKQEMYILYPWLKHAPDNEQTQRQLRSAARHAWWVIRDNALVRLSETMPHRVQAADGWYTKY